MTRSRADAAPSWVWAPELGAAGRELDLEADESHYVSRVCRARPDDPLHLTDGRGRVARGVVLAIGPRVRVRVDEVQARPRTGSLELWCGAPEGERADWLVEKLAELGVARLVLLDTRRAAWQRAAGRLDRWQRLSVAALRQSQQAWRLEIAGPLALEPALEALGAGTRRLLAQPGGGALGAALAGAGDAVGVVGPSAGLHEDERERLRREDFLPIGLAPARLRAETAGVALAAGWAAWTLGAAGLDGPGGRP